MFFVNGQPVGADEMPGGFPGGFGGFPGGFGGMPGGGGGGRGPAKEVDNNKFYEILEVPKDADETVIRKSYRDFKHTLKLSLEDMYKGITKKLQMSRNIMNEQGTPIRREKTVLDVVVEPGTANGKQFRFKGMADEMPGCDTGDVLITVVEKAHEVFHRKGNHLFILNKDITIGEALTGFEMVVKTLDGRQLHVKSSPGEITLPENHYKCIYEEGMPLNGNKYTKGNLYIQMNIKFPEQGSLTDEQIEHLNAAFPPPKATKVPESAEEHVTMPISEDQLKRHLAQSQQRNQYDSDDEDEGMGRGGAGQSVQCAQQ